MGATPNTGAPGKAGTASAHGQTQSRELPAGTGHWGQAGARGASGPTACFPRCSSAGQVRRLSSLDFLSLFLEFWAQNFRRFPQKTGEWSSERGASKTRAGRKRPICHLVPERQHRERMTDQCEGSEQPLGVPTPPAPVGGGSSVPAALWGPSYIKGGRVVGGKQRRTELGAWKEGGGAVSEDRGRRRDTGELTGHALPHTPRHTRVHARPSACTKPHMPYGIQTPEHAHTDGYTRAHIQTDTQSCVGQTGHTRMATYRAGTSNPDKELRSPAKRLLSSMPRDK